MRMQLDRESPTPIHLQIANGIREQILTGAIPEDRRLPPTRRLAAELGVNRSTVVQAYQRLWSEGLVEGRVGSGTVVRLPAGEKRRAVAPPPWSMLLGARVGGHDAESGELFRLFAREDLVSLAAGLPAPHLYPMEDLREAANAAFAEEGRAALHWCPAEGYPPLRRLAAERLDGLDPAATMILAGSTQGLFLVSALFIDPGDFVVVESPTYLGALQIFRDAGARVIGVPVAEDGIDLEMLGEVLARTQPKFIYTVPTFQNPTGVTMSLGKRRALLELAYRYRVPVVEDDPYTPLRYDGGAVPSLKALDTHGYVIYLTTFSKILVSGLRVGVLGAPRRLMEPMVAAKYRLDLFTGALSQAMVQRFWSGGALDRHIDRVRVEYRANREAMADALRRHCPTIRFSVPEGGFFIWGRLPREVGARRLLREALDRKVMILSGEIFHPDGRGHDRVRLSFTGETPERLREGVRRLGDALRRVERGAPSPDAVEEATTKPIL
ncbi:MAG: PLP-dependent aminotransferase family protein [Candidatus Eisenbacteria bacterium]|nr:PLP-dependent aminotransferase family protein [Candidatus Eisenbacteria bacterium]